MRSVGGVLGAMYTNFSLGWDAGEEEEGLGREEERGRRCFSAVGVDGRLPKRARKTEAMVISDWGAGRGRAGWGPGGDAYIAPRLARRDRGSAGASFPFRSLPHLDKTPRREGPPVVHARTALLTPKRTGAIALSPGRTAPASSAATRPPRTSQIPGPGIFRLSSPAIPSTAAQNDQRPPLSQRMPGARSASLMAPRPIINPRPARVSEAHTLFSEVHTLFLRYIRFSEDHALDMTPPNASQKRAQIHPISLDAPHYHE